MTVALCAFVLLAASRVGAQEDTSRAHTVKRGDTLWDLAKLYLGDSFLWPEIYRVNTDIIDDPHWIYPGEVLKLPAPGATPTVAEGPPVKQAGEPLPPPPPPVTPSPASAPLPAATGSPVYEPPVGVLDGPNVFPKNRVEQVISKRRDVPPPPTPAVSIGTYLQAPYVDRKGGPRGAGSILEVISLSVTTAARDEMSRVQLHDELVVTPPAGSAAPEGERYITYTVGPYLEDLGQIVIPTGIVEVTRAPRDREAAVVQVIHMFTEITSDQRLLPYDSASTQFVARPEPATDSVVTKVKLITSGAILPSIQDYLVVDVSSRDGVKLGDEFELFQPRHGLEGGDGFSAPEVAIAQAQAVRVTQYGTTLMITGEKHPKIEAGTLARRVAAMP
jgi:hypothetical protein